MRSAHFSPSLSEPEWFQKGWPQIHLALPFLGPSNECVLEKAMAAHSSTLTWEIPWTEEPGRLQSMGSQRVRHNWATSLSLFTFMHWRRKWQPTPVFLPEESRGRRSLVGCLWVAQSRTRLMWLSNSSNECVCDRYTVVTRELSWEYCGSFLPMSYTKGPFLKYLFKLPVLWLVTL